MIRITVSDYDSAKRRIEQLETAIQSAADELTDFLLTNVPDNENWEDAFPEPDFARTLLLEVIS